MAGLGPLAWVFFVKDTATTEIYTYCHTLSLRDALPISAGLRADGRAAPPHRRARRGAAFASRPAGDAHLALRRRLARADDPRAPGRGGLRAPQERAAAADHHPLPRHPLRQRHAIGRA